MAHAIIKSIFWLSTCGFVGYALLKITTQQEPPTNLRGLDSPTVRQQKTQQFMNVLSAASNSNSPPLHKLDKKQFDEDIKKK